MKNTNKNTSATIITANFVKRIISMLLIIGALLTICNIPVMGKEPTNEEKFNEMVIYYSKIAKKDLNKMTKIEVEEIKNELAKYKPLRDGYINDQIKAYEALSAILKQKKQK